MPAGAGRSTDANRAIVGDSGWFHAVELRQERRYADESSIGTRSGERREGPYLSLLILTIASLPSLAIFHVHRRRLGSDSAGRNLSWSFLLGALSTAIVLAAAPLLAPPGVIGSSAYARGLFQALVSAAIPEELVKLLVLAVAVATGCVRDRRSGLAHGLAAALGFAAVEMMLFAGVTGLPATALRAVTTLPCHAFLGCLMGRLMADAFCGERVRLRRAALAFLAPVLIHGAYDFPLMVLANEDSPARPGTWSFAFLAILSTSMLVGSALVAARLHRDAFRPRLRSVAARPLRLRHGMTARRAGLVAWALIPIGVLLASVGGAIVGSLLFVDLSSVPSIPNAGTATTVLWTGGGALVCFGLAVGIRGLRTRHTARQLLAARA